MPIMAASERNDARSAAWLLANAALDCLENPDAAPDQEVALNNVYRLLETLRVDAFFTSESPRRPFPPRSTDTISLMPTVEKHVSDVKNALENAIQSIFVDVSRDDAIETVEGALRAIAYPEEFERPSKEQIEKTSRFFDAVVKNLRLG